MCCSRDCRYEYKGSAGGIRASVYDKCAISLFERLPAFRAGSFRIDTE